MALIKKNELKRMKEAELKEKMKELNKELMKILTQKSSGGSLENPGKIRAIKKTIARMITMLHEKKYKTTKEEMRKI